jgi:hypothetical protein
VLARSRLSRTLVHDGYVVPLVRSQSRNRLKIHNHTRKATLGFPGSFLNMSPYVSLLYHIDGHLMFNDRNRNQGNGGECVWYSLSSVKSCASCAGGHWLTYERYLVHGCTECIRNPLLFMSSCMNTMTVNAVDRKALKSRQTVPSNWYSSKHYT